MDSIAVVFNGKLHFTGGTLTYGYELRSFDGTSSAPTLVHDIYPGSVIIDGVSYGPYSSSPVRSPLRQAMAPGVTPTPTPAQLHGLVPIATAALPCPSACFITMMGLLAPTGGTHRL